MTAFPGFCMSAVVRGAPWGAGRRAGPTRAAATALRGKGFPPLPAPPAGSGGRRAAATALRGKGFPLLPAPAAVSGGRRAAGPALRGKGFPPLPAPAAVSGERRTAALRGRRPGLVWEGLPVASGSGSRPEAQGRCLSPAARAGYGVACSIAYFLCHTFPSSNVILCGSGKSSVLRHNRGTSAKRRPVWRRRCRPSTGGAKAGAVCARRQAKNGRPPSQPVRGGLGAYRPRFPFWDVSLPVRRSHNPTSCKQPRTCRADRVVPG